MPHVITRKKKRKRRRKKKNMMVLKRNNQPLVTPPCWPVIIYYRSCAGINCLSWKSFNISQHQATEEEEDENKVTHFITVIINNRIWFDWRVGCNIFLCFSLSLSLSLSLVRLGRLNYCDNIEWKKNVQKKKQKRWSNRDKIKIL